MSDAVRGFGDSFAGGVSGDEETKADPRAGRSRDRGRSAGGGRGSSRGARRGSREPARRGGGGWAGDDKPSDDDDRRRGSGARRSGSRDGSGRGRSGDRDGGRGRDRGRGRSSSRSPRPRPRDGEGGRDDSRRRRGSRDDALDGEGGGRRSGRRSGSGDESGSDDRGDGRGGRERGRDGDREGRARGRGRSRQPRFDDERRRSLSPLPPPSDVRNVQSQVAVWKAFRRRNGLLPVSIKAVDLDSVSRGYCVLIDSAEFVVPRPLRALEGHIYSVSFRLGMFSLTSRHFVGKTYRSKRPRRVTVHRSSVRVQFNDVVYFHTRIRDPSVHAVLELVLTVDEADGSRLGQYSVGWTWLELFSKDGPPPSLSGGGFDDREESISKALRAGSPRALMFATSLQDLRPVSHTGVSFRVHSFHRKLKKMHHLVPQNLFFDDQDLIPGLRLVKLPPSEAGGVEDKMVPRMLTLTAAEDRLAQEADRIAALRSKRRGKGRGRSGRGRSSRRRGGESDEDDRDDEASDGGAGELPALPLPTPIAPELAPPLKLKLSGVSVYFPAAFESRFDKMLIADRALFLGVHPSALQPCRITSRSLIISLHNGYQELETRVIPIGSNRGVFESDKVLSFKRYSPSSLMAVTLTVAYDVIKPTRRGLIPKLKAASAPLPENRALTAGAARAARARGQDARAAGAAAGGVGGAAAADVEAAEAVTVLVATQAYIPSNGTTVFDSNVKGRQRLTRGKIEVPLRGPRLSKGLDGGTGAVVIKDGAIDAAAGDVHGLVKYGDESIVVGFNLSTAEMTEEERNEPASDEEVVWNVDTDADPRRIDFNKRNAQRQREADLEKERRHRDGSDRDSEDSRDRRRRDKKDRRRRSPERSDAEDVDEDPLAPEPAKKRGRGRRDRVEEEDDAGEEEAKGVDDRRRPRRTRSSRDRDRRREEEEEEAEEKAAAERRRERRRRARAREAAEEAEIEMEREAAAARARRRREAAQSPPRVASPKRRQPRRRSSPESTPPKVVREPRPRRSRSRGRRRDSSPASTASVRTGGSADSVVLPPPAALLTDPLILETLGLRLGVDDPAMAAQVRAAGMMPQGVGDTLAGGTYALGATRTGVPPLAMTQTPALPVDTADVTLFTPRAAAVLGTSAPPLAAELSRADRTRLSRLGFDDATAPSDLRRSRERALLQAANPGMTLAAPPPDLALELSDPLQGHELRFQFAAFRVLGSREIGSLAPPPPPRAIYFTFRFYTFDAVRSSRLELAREPDTDPPLYVLTTAMEDGMDRGAYGESKAAGPPNVAAEYRVDPTLVSPGEARNFATYLGSKALQVEVWDADSHLPVGEMLVDLSCLLRQQKRSVKVGREYDVVASGMTADMQTIVPVGGAGSATAGQVVGKLQLLMSNHGFKGQGRDKFQDVVVRPTRPGDAVGGTFDPSRTEVSVVGTRTITKTVAKKMSMELMAHGAGRSDAELELAEPKDNVITYDEVLVLKRRYDPDDRDRVAFQEFITDLRRGASAGTGAGARAGGRWGRGVGGTKEEETKGSDSGGLETRTRKAIIDAFTRAIQRGQSPRTVLSRLDRDGDRLLRRSEVEEASRIMQCRWSPDHIDTIMRMFGRSIGSGSRATFGAQWEDMVDLVHSSSKGASGSATFDVLVNKVKNYLAKHPHTDLRANFLAADYIDPGIVRWRAFFGALEDSGFVVKQSRQSDKAAALARAQQAQIDKWKDETGARRPSDKALTPEEEAEEWNRRKKEMMQLRMYRETHKKRVFGQRLKEHITTEYHIYPSFGKREFFEFNVSNPYAHDDTFRIEVEDHHNELKVVTDADEWRFLRRAVPRACGDVGTGEVEDGMLSSSNELLLAPRETVSVPFTFLSLASGIRRRGARSDVALHALALEREMASGKLPMSERTVVASVISAKHGQSIALLRVHVHPRPFVVDRSVRFYNAEREVLKRSIIMHPGSGGFAGATGTWNGDFTEDSVMGKFVYCPDDDVVVTSAEGPRGTREIKLKYHCGRAMERASFFVLLYNDQYNALLHQVWRVWVHPMLRHDVHATMGQGTVVSLKLKADRSRRVQVYTSVPNEVKLAARAIDLVGGSFNAVDLLYQPLSAGKKHVHVHLIDVDTRRLVQAWRLSASTSAPQVSRAYTLSLPLGRSVSKKIGYANPWARSRVFYLRSSNPTLLRLRDEEINIAARAKSFIRFTLAPVAVPRREEFFIFINDRSEQNEECLLIRAHFQ